jgi:Spy/CpxP family protein refolding chaperone
MTEMTNRPWKAAILLLAVFIAGAFVGGAVMGRRAPMASTRGPDGMIRHLTEELGLQPAQQDSIRAVLERWRPAMDSAWSEVRPRLETVRARIRSDIAAQLTDEQRAQYEEMVRQHAERHQRGTTSR